LGVVIGSHRQFAGFVGGSYRQLLAVGEAEQGGKVHIKEW
jgi:hypothetical protein